MLLTSPINSDLCSTMPHGAIPIKCTWDVLSVSIAPRDITVWPFTASPTWRITPVFVPPVIIHAPVVLAACAKNFEERLTVKFKKLLWMQPFYAYFTLLWMHVFEVTDFFKTFNSFFLMLNKRPSMGTLLLWCLVTIKADWSIQVLRKGTLYSHGSHGLFQNLQLVLSNVKQETVNGYPFTVVSRDDKGRLIHSGAKERDLV